MHFPFIASTTIFGSICDPFFFHVSDILCTPIGQVADFVLSLTDRSLNYREITERQDGQQITG